MSSSGNSTRWQVVRLADGAVSICCTHRSPTVASWCTAWRNRFRPWWEITGPRYDLRQEIRR